MIEFIKVYPFAAASSAALYLLLIALAIPASRRFLVPYFTHPVPPHQQYLQGFDALRGIAAAMVAIGHCWWATYPLFASTQLAVPMMAYATKWVSIFAVLSGFLIYRSAISAIQSSDSLREYLIRRFFRIYPVYALCVFLGLAFGQYTGNANAGSVSYFFSDLFLFPSLNWPGGFANPPAWSLYVEVMFYVLLPLVLLLVGQKRIVAFCLVMILVMLLADNASRVFALWKYFLIGIIASELSPRLSSRTALLGVAAGLLLVIADFGGPKFDWAADIGIGIEHADGQTVGLGLGFGLLLAGLPQVQILGRMLSVLPLEILGVISYSVYLTQFFYIYMSFPVITLFVKAGSQGLYKHFAEMPPYSALVLPLLFFPGCLTWGVVSYLAVERPGMIFGRKLVARLRSAAADRVRDNASA